MSSSKGSSNKRATPATPVSPAPQPKKRKAASTEKREAVDSSAPTEGRSIIKTTDEHLNVIRRILDFRMNYCRPLRKVVGYSGFRCEASPYFAFPLILKPGAKKGQLPAEFADGRPGYEPAAILPGDIRLAIRDAFQEVFTGKFDDADARWHDWEIWKWNSAYYGNSFDHGFLNYKELSASIQSDRSFGGTTNSGRTGGVKLVSAVGYKKYLMVVYFEDYYRGQEDALREVLNLPADTAISFMTKAHMLKLHEAYMIELEKEKQKKAERASLKLDKSEAKKKVRDASEASSSEDNNNSE